MENVISILLTDTKISSEEFMLISNYRGKYHYLKERIAMMKN